MEQITVSLGDRSYPIYIGSELLGQAELVRRHVVGGQVALITNETVAPLYQAKLLAAFDGLQTDVYQLPDGEQYKTLESFERIVDFLLQHRHNRSTTLIALGGGVVGDLTGFVAATFQRGVAFLQVPTTLLAQVDSSVGGKTAVNHSGGKNMIGAFYQPRAVLADMSTLMTLPAREYRAGLAEVLKYGVIADVGFFDWIEAHVSQLMTRDVAALSHIVRRSCEIKAEIVAEDERESGVRALLNFGHTFGHALEKIGGYRTHLHGEAVAIGMVMAADLSARQGLLDSTLARRIKDLLVRLELPVVPPANTDAGAMLDAMGMDKKVRDGKLRLVLARSIGRAVVTEDIDTAALSRTLNAYRELCDG